MENKETDCPICGDSERGSCTPAANCLNIPLAAELKHLSAPPKPVPAGDRAKTPYRHITADDRVLKVTALQTEQGKEYYIGNTAERAEGKMVHVKALLFSNMATKAALNKAKCRS